MKTRNRSHQIISFIVSLAMLLQMLVPAMLPAQATSDNHRLGEMDAADATAVSTLQTHLLTNANEPDALSHPVSLSRYQSQAVSGATIVISYTVTNNQLPTLEPNLDGSGTYTDTVDALASFVLTDDMNTLHNPVLEMTLTNGTLVEGNGASQNGNTLTWNLPDILPQASHLVTVTVAAPASASDFVELDDGAQVTADLWDSQVTMQTRPTAVIPDSVSASYIMGTIDADVGDEDMLWAATAFTQDPVAAFHLVRGFGYDPYKGSLRGTRGTLWGEAGNSLDQSSLLIALLRSAAVPARYRHGSLNTADAQTLLISMFTPDTGLAGYLPDNAVTSDPLNNPALIAQAQDHWWVEAYLPGQGWTDLDPSFPTAQVGDSFATPGSNDRIAEIPDNLRHKVTMRLQVEQYNSFPVGGVSLSSFVPLSGTFSTAQIASKAVILGHLIDTDAPPGLIYTSVQHTYTPYFGINGDKFVETGDPFDDLLTSFPLASHFTTAEWITFEVTDADGNSQTFTREVKDIIGAGTRLLGGSPVIQSPANNEPFIQFEDSFTAVFLPNHLRNAHYARRQQTELQQRLFSLAQFVAAMPRDDGGLDTPAGEAQAGEALFQIEVIRSLLFGLSGLEFAKQADPLADALQENLQVKLYYNQPRLIIMQGVSGADDDSARTVDLRYTSAQAIVAPGQAPEAAHTAHWAKAVAESIFEGEALRDTLGQTPVTTARIFEEAKLQGIDFVYLKPDQFDMLDLYLSDQTAYGYAAVSLLDGKEILIPTAPVLIDGKMRLGWWEIDPATGAAVSVLDNGLHGAAMEYGMMVAKIAVKVLQTWNKFGKKVDQLWNDCIVDNVVPALQGSGRSKAPACLSGWSPPGRTIASQGTPWFFLPDHQCPIDNCGLEQFLVQGYNQAPLPLPEMPFQYYLDGLDAIEYAGEVIAVTDGGGGGSPAFSLTPSGTGTLIPMQTYDLGIGASANFDGSLDVWSYVPSGWSIGFASSPQLQVVAPEDTLAGDYTILIVGQSQSDRSLIATAVHTVTVPQQEALTLDYFVEDNITIPMGAAVDAAVSNQTNDGEAEIPDSAFRLDLFNQSDVTKTINLDVSGAPVGWVVLNGRSQTQAAVILPPYNRTRVGLYVLPPTLPTPGTSFIMNVTADDGGSLNDTVSIPWAMPGQAHNYMQISPDVLFAQPNGSVDFDLTMSNVGNMAGSFPITATLPISTWTISNLQSPISLNEGEMDNQTPTLNVTTAEEGRRYPLLYASSAPGSYTQYALAEVQIVSPLTEPVYRAAESCNLGSDALSGALQSLAFSMTTLELSCNSGSCDLNERDVTVTAAQSAASYAGSLSTNVTADTTIQNMADLLATRTDDGDILADLNTLSAAVSDLNTELCALEEHGPNARFDPYLDAVLLGDTAVFTLSVQNQGTLTTTYDVTVTTPSGNQTFNPTILAGGTAVIPVNTTPAQLGNYDVTAAVVAVGLPVAADTAVARLNVVDKFVQVIQVTADPPFVETGSSSTDLSIEVANVASIRQDVIAHTEILTPGGGLQWSDDISLTLTIGNPQVYPLATVNTSGWAKGIYTITVDLGIPDGYNFGYFSVGEALGVRHSVSPAIAPPGNITVTTMLTTELVGGTILPLATDDGRRMMDDGQRSSVNGHRLTVIGQSLPVNDTTGVRNTDNELRITNNDSALPIPHSAITTITGTVILRHEEDDAALTGSWTNFSNGRASNGRYTYSRNDGDTAAFTFDGSWVSLGFWGKSDNGHSEVFIDGLSQGTLDLYRRDEEPISFFYSGLVSATHTISLTVLGTANPHSSDDYVRLDYMDAWNGGAYADGTFEQDDNRLFLSTGWINVNDANASGGSYMRGNGATAWFPFTGSSVTYQGIAYNGGGKARVYLDGRYQTTLNLYNLSAITRSLSFTGLAAGPHILQVNHYRGNTTVDAFITPANGNHYTPPTILGFNRTEEDDLAMLYNGVPFTTTATTWTRSYHIYNSEASDGQYIYSNTAADTVSYDFNGDWVSIGFFTDDDAGEAEIFLDGLSRGVVDLYSNEEDVTSFTYPNLITGAHTISVTVLGTANPFSSNDYVYMDYVDVWDGRQLSTGAFEQTDGRVIRSGGWIDTADASASGGSYMEEVLHGDSTVWVPFTEDSITYQAFNYFRSNEVQIYIDEVLQGNFDIRNNSGVPTITHSFDNLGAGLHILKLRQYRDEAAVDAFHIPAITPSTPPLTPTAVTRHEEDDPAILYNDVPYGVSNRTWDRVPNNWRASGGQYILSDGIGDWISYDFDGTWVNVGFVTYWRGGQTEIFIDGNSQGVVDLYTTNDNVTNVVYAGLAAGNHTISMTVLSTAHPHSLGNEVMFDYIDTWDGGSVPPGTYEEDNPLVIRSDEYDNWTTTAEPAASGGAYIASGSLTSAKNGWFAFTGDSVTFLGLADTSGNRVGISIDGLWQGDFNLYNSLPISRPFTFAGLGAGPHVIQVNQYRGALNVDAFMTPGFGPITQTPVYTGVVRYEEDNLAIVYNGQDGFWQRSRSWTRNNSAQTSADWNVGSGTVGDAVELTFDGRWVNIGFRTRNQTGQVEVFIDGISQGIIVLPVTGEDVTSFQYGNLITGTHTISVAVASGTVYFDYFDVWDGLSLPDDMVNLSLSEDSGRVHVSSGLAESSHANAISGDFISARLLNTNSNIWYTFTGDSFTYFAFSRSNSTWVDLYVDGVLVDNIDQSYPFTEQPTAYHYTGFTDGPHVVRVHNGSYLRSDAFQSNPSILAPYQPRVEWYDDAPNGSTGAFGTPAGMIMGIAAGDIDADGEVEIVAPSDTYTSSNGFINSIFIYRGDGEDAGNGSPLIRRIDFPSLGTSLGRETIGSVALADLDGQSGAEIIIGSELGMYAFYGNGVTYWFTDTFQGPSNPTTITPMVGNLDLDPEPEIVVNMNQTLVVYEADGAIGWSQTFTGEVGMPLLADLTGDGLLDIVAYDVNGQVRLYDYNLGTPQLLWQTALSTTIGIVRGGPAIVDVDGNGNPEIAISHDGFHTVLDKDGNVVWSTQLDPGAPGGVSVADIDGDNEIEIVTGMRYDDGIGVGRLYALNADGSILWQVPAYDSTSANSQSVLDVDGDGVYEIAWNGAQYGFTIFNGVDGAILFNEPLAESLTATDYPIFADVDLDGYAEIVVPSNDGIRVFGFDGVWGSSRPLWNQHSYHISNINDDLTVPFSEPNSWDVHNTYRTQTTLLNPLPNYQVILSHTVAITDVAVISGTFSVPPTVAADPLYAWNYNQTAAADIITRTFQSALSNLQPGEIRKVAEGTEVAYTLASGTNYLTLPPLYVTGAHLVTLQPALQTIPAGGTAVYTATLVNPDTVNGDTYTLALSGVPTAWVNYAASVPLAPGETVNIPLTITVPANNDPDLRPLILDVTNGGSGTDQTGAELQIVDGVDVQIMPDGQTAVPGQSVTYTLTISNLESVDNNYTVSASGLATVTLPGSFFV
ncbi:MAG: hypothetical protein GY796_23685, partial [Chloroflexi bacterium]|nr:hypothetical protein [Chloroflexota bacterium]